jgi:putative methionine-R-sulfoxide reductase with GAF domain
MKNYESADNILEIFLKSLNIKNSVIRRREGGTLVLVSSIGYNSDEPEEIRDFRYGMSGLCAEKNITVAVNDLDLYHDKYFVGLDFIRSAVSIPLTVNNTVVGTINFASESKNNFDKKKIEILENFAEMYKNILLINFAKKHQRVAWK